MFAPNPPEPPGSDDETPKKRASGARPSKRKFKGNQFTMEQKAREAAEAQARADAEAAAAAEAARRAQVSFRASKQQIS